MNVTNSYKLLGIVKFLILLASLEVCIYTEYTFFLFMVFFEIPGLDTLSLF